MRRSTFLFLAESCSGILARSLKANCSEAERPLSGLETSRAKIDAKSSIWSDRLRAACFSLHRSQCNGFRCVLEYTSFNRDSTGKDDPARAFELIRTGTSFISFSFHFYGAAVFRGETPENAWRSIVFLADVDRKKTPSTRPCRRRSA